VASGRSVRILDPRGAGWTTSPPATSPGLFICDIEVAGLKDVPPGVAFLFEELEMLRMAMAAGEKALKGTRAEDGLTVVIVSAGVLLVVVRVVVVAHLEMPMRRLI
jgi:hypothetical protein